MRGKWEISSQYWGNKKVFQVYRLMDVDEADHGGNREYAPDAVFETRVAAQLCADDLNRMGT